MSELDIEVETEKSSMGEIRSALDAALDRQFPGGMLKHHWVGDVLELTGPGAEATIALHEGRLVGRGELSPPACGVRPVIEQKFTAAMREAVT